MAIKMAQICDQPKECEESGIKCLYVGSRVNKIGNLTLQNRSHSPSSNAMKRHVTKY